jgi:hypothetical protein
VLELDKKKIENATARNNEAIVEAWDYKDLIND